MLSLPPTHVGATDGIGLEQVYLPPIFFLGSMVYSAQQIGIYEIGGIDIIMWNELGISGGTAIVILIALYFVIKWAVKNGIKEAYSAITGKKTDEDIKNEKELKELGLDSENQ